MEVVKKKICLLGDSGVGKTSLIRQFVVGKYDDKYLSTLGTKVSKKTISFDANKIKLTMMIWDLTGQTEFHHIHASAFKNAEGALVVGDITRKETIDNMENWISALYNTSGEIPVVVLGNKLDLIGVAEVNEEQLKSHSSKLGFRHMLTSAKTGVNVEKAFETIGMMIMGMLKAPSVKVDVDSVQKKMMPEGSRMLEIEDRLIARFCELMGSMDFGMSIIRKQFKDSGIDFTNPDLKDLEKIADKLVDILKVFKGEAQAKKVKMEFADIMRDYQDEEVPNGNPAQAEDIG
jgi:small GTP-binding protein